MLWTTNDVERILNEKREEIRIRHMREEYYKLAKYVFSQLGYEVLSVLDALSHDPMINISSASIHETFREEKEITEEMMDWPTLDFGQWFLIDRGVQDPTTKKHKVVIEIHFFWGQNLKPAGMSIDFPGFAVKGCCIDKVCINNLIEVIETTLTGLQGRLRFRFQNPD